MLEKKIINLKETVILNFLKEAKNISKFNNLKEAYISTKRIFEKIDIEYRANILNHFLSITFNIERNTALTRKEYNYVKKETAGFIKKINAMSPETYRHSGLLYNYHRNILTTIENITHNYASRQNHSDDTSTHAITSSQ